MIAIGTIIHSLTEYTLWKSRKENVYLNLENRIEKYEMPIRDCKLLLNSKPNPYETERKYENTHLFSDKYINLQKKLTKLDQAVTYYLSHSSMILDKYEIMIDKISNEIIFGRRDYSLVPCHKYTIHINDQKYPINKLTKTYTLPKSDKVEIQFEKIAWSWEYNKLDTILVNRNFDSKNIAVYNNR